MSSKNNGDEKLHKALKLLTLMMETELHCTDNAKCELDEAQLILCYRM